MSCTPSDEKTIFSASALTNAYAGGLSSGDIEVRANDKFTLIAVYTGGAAETGNTCEIEVSFGDGTNYAQYGFWSAAATSTYTAQTFQIAQDTNAVIGIESLARNMRIRAKESGVASAAGALTLTLYRNKN